LAAVERLRVEQSVRRDALSTVERELSVRQEDLRKAQAEAFSASQGLGRIRNEINQLALQLQGNVVRLEKLNSEKIQFEEERVRLEMQGVEFTQQVEAERVQVQTSRMTLEERQQRLKALQAEIVQATQERDALLRQQAEKRSKLGVLEQLATQHEGFGAGALAALKQSKHVLGSLADRLKVSDAHVLAVEAALGNNLQIVLTEQPAAASEILADLSANRKGRASIAALSLLAAAPAEPATTLPDGVVLALSVVEAEASGICRASANIMAMACSAVVMVLPCGVFITTTPRAVADRTSTLSTPIPARPTTFRLVAASSSSRVTLVADRMASPSYSPMIARRSAGDRPGFRSTSTPRDRKISTANGDRLSLIRTLGMESS
jgi:hypothetical protein